MREKQTEDSHIVPKYSKEYLVVLRPHTTGATPCEIIHVFRMDVDQEWEYLVQPVNSHARFVVKADELELAIGEKGNVKKNTDT